MRFRTEHYIGIMGVILACMGVLLVGIVAPHAEPRHRAVFYMAGMLLGIWCLGFGAFSRLMRDRVRDAALAIPMRWQLKFVLFATLLALLEEVVTVTATNMAPVFGVPIGAAYLTASANYLDVVCLHSVVVFVPGYIVWAWLLARYEIHPNAAFIVYGLFGTLAEVIFGGPQHIFEMPVWTFVYGLMIYLPVYCVPHDRGATRPPWFIYPALALLPVIAAGPFAAIISHYHPIKVHFPPLT